MTARPAYDVIVVGGGPGGSTAAAVLARKGLRVAIFEREPFPRFHIGESLIPATVALLGRIGALGAVERHGFLIKRGAYFTDQESGLESTFRFLTGQPWPPYAYQVPRAEFDSVLLEYARGQGVEIHQPQTVEAVTFDGDGATVTVGSGPEQQSVRAAFLVDASGRDGLLATRIGRRHRVPNLGKVAIFAHFRGAARLPGDDEGNIQIHVFEDGWFWWIPFTGDVTSVGCVLHARSVRGRRQAVEDTFMEMAGRCDHVAKGLAGAEPVTLFRTAANFAYVNEPLVGDRFVCVGDAVAFVDPIFSGGVHIAMQSGELAAEAIARAFRTGRFEARRFRGYERALWRGVRPFFRFIHKYYEPAFLELFLKPKNYLGMRDAVLAVLAGGAFLGMPWRRRVALQLLFALARINVAVRRRAGLPIESRLEW